MPRQMFLGVFLAGVFLTLGLLGPQGVRAGTTVGVQAFGTFNTHAMDDVNDAIEVDNQNGYGYDQLDNGFTGGLGLRVWQGGRWMFDASWEPLFLATEDEANDSEWNMDAQSVQLGVAYFFPSQTKLKLGAGAGIGFYSVSGENEDPSQTPSSLAIEGSGVGFHFLGLGEWSVSPAIGVTAGAGYRLAEIEIDDSSNDSTVDYSGFVGRLGLAFYFPSH